MAPFSITVNSTAELHSTHISTQLYQFVELCLHWCYECRTVSHKFAETTLLETKQKLVN